MNLKFLNLIKSRYPFTWLYFLLIGLILSFMTVSIASAQVNEYDTPSCRWPHTGAIKFLKYEWGTYLQNPSALWRIAYQSSVQDWNNTSIPFSLSSTTSGSHMNFDIYWDSAGGAGWAQPSCNGSNTTFYAVRGNASHYTGASNYNRRRSVTGHEIGHAFSVGHISNSGIALLGNNPDPNTYYTPQSLDVNLIKQVYP